MRLEPPCNANNKHSFLSRVGHAFQSLTDLDILAQLLGLLIGLGFLGFVFLFWVAHFLQQGSYFSGILLTCIELLLVILAMARVPAALIVVFGGAAVCAAAVFGGFTHVLLP